MRKSELIAKLNEIEGDPNVYIYDHRKNIGDDSGDGSSMGIYTPEAFLVDQWSDMDEEERNFHIEEHETEIKPWIALSFDNEDLDVWTQCSSPECKKIYECADTISVGNKSTCPNCKKENNTRME